MNEQTRINGLRALIRIQRDPSPRLLAELSELERSLSARTAAATLLGKTKSPKKAAASRENGRKGGRPKKQTFQDWQLDPERLDTTSVQLWTRSGTMAGLVHLQTAMQLVKRGTHFVISSQAVGEKESSETLRS